MSYIKRLTEADQDNVRKYIYNDFWGCIELAKRFDKTGLKHIKSNKDSGIYYGYFEEEVLLGLFLFTNNGRFLLHFKSENVTKKVDLLKAIKHHRPDFMSGPSQMVDSIWKMFERTVKRYNYKKTMYMVLNEKVALPDLTEDIREAQMEDAKKHVNFMVGVEKYFGRNHMTINQLQKRIEDRLGSQEYLLAMKDNYVVGQAFVEEKINAFWQIGGVFTTPALRGQGLGKRLVSLLSWHIQEKGYIPILAVLADNKPAVHVYQQLGFEKAMDFAIIEIEF